MAGDMQYLITVEFLVWAQDYEDAREELDAALRRQEHDYELEEGHV